MTTENTFDLYAERFDQKTFNGRLRRSLNLIDPRTLLPKVFFGLSLNEAQTLLKQYETNTLPLGTEHRRLLNAKKIVEATLHPDTGEKVPAPFRMSGFVPFGSPIVVGLLLPNPTIWGTIFWQALNQTHNALVNYYNRNATKPVPNSILFQSYLGAVGSAVGIAASLSLILDKSKGLSPGTRFFVQRFVPFPAVAAAGVCNALLMRRNELNTGIDIKDENGNTVGTSKLAARKALYETALSRAVLPAPVLLSAPVIMTLYERSSLMKMFPKRHLLVQTVVTTLSFGVALPIALSLFPQIGSIKASELENEFKDLGKDVFYYNKGL